MQGHENTSDILSHVHNSRAGPRAHTYYYPVQLHRKAPRLMGVLLYARCQKHAAAMGAQVATGRPLCGCRVACANTARLEKDALVEEVTRLYSLTHLQAEGDADDGAAQDSAHYRIAEREDDAPVQRESRSHTISNIVDTGSTPEAPYACSSRVPLMLKNGCSWRDTTAKSTATERYQPAAMHERPHEFVRE